MTDKRKWEIDVNLVRYMVREEGGVSGKVILSPSSKAQTLRFEKKISPTAFPQ